MNDRALAALTAFAALAFGAAIAAGLPGLAPKLLPPEQAFRFSARVLDPATIEARFDVADGYYLYRDKLHFTVEPVQVLAVDLPPGQRKHDEFFGDVETYRGVLTVRLPLASAASGKKLVVHAESQGCADAGVCYPPNPQKLTLAVPAKGATPGSFVEAAPKGLFR